MVNSGPSTFGASLWPARLAILTIIVLQVLLNERVTVGPNWLLPALEAALLVPLSAVRTAHVRNVGTAPSRRSGWLPSHGATRVMAFGLIALLNLGALNSLRKVLSSS